MIYRLLAAVLIFSYTLSAQQNSSSPYSFFGIGLSEYNGIVENRSMGGLGIYSDSIRVNLQNPAGWSHFKLVNFSAGASYNYAALKSDKSSGVATNSAINYIVLGFPISKKMGISFGVMPNSSVGYALSSTENQSITFNSGEGGTTKVYLGAGYQITPELSVGVQAAYNFGEIENTTIFSHDEVQYGTKEFNRSHLSGFSYNLGAMYKKKVAPQLELVAAATYGLQSELKSENYRRISSVLVVSELQHSEIDGMDIEVADSYLTMPSQFSVGAGLGEPQKWFVGLEYFTRQKSSYINRTITLADVTAKNTTVYRLGGYYLPDYRAFSSYHKKITYRAGLRYENTGLLLKGQDINEFGISFGVGLPVGRLFSSINIGVEVGKRGTTQAGLVQENFINTFIGFTLNDRWFVKTLYD